MNNCFPFRFLITLSLLFASSSNLIGQSCDIVADPITGEKLVEFKNKQQTLKYIYKGGEKVEFFTTFIYKDEQNTTFPAGSEVFIKMDNGLITQLNSVDEAVPQTKVTTTSETVTVNTWYTFKFFVTREQVEQLASGKIVFMRYPAIDGGTVDLDIKGFGKIYAKKITKGAECIKENL